MKIKIAELKDTCISILVKKGLTKKDAELVFAEYLDAEQRGRVCHGFQSFVDFAAKLVTNNGTPRIIKETGCFLFLDGNLNLGQVVCAEYMPKLIEKAKSNGIAMMGIKNMHSYLMPGTYARMAANNDLIAMIFNYGGKARIAPSGSIDPIFGTNPIAVGIPCEKMPIVIDMATSKTSLMSIRLAKKLGLPIPDDLAIDSSGKPTNDPSEALEGAVLPFGGYKGSDLALAVEIMTKTMFGITDKEKGRGFLFILIDPSIFQPIHQFKNDVLTLANKILSSRKSNDGSNLAIPGWKSQYLKNTNIKEDSIELDQKIIEEIEKQK